jgi:PAS domain S-box-containing protein
VLATNDGISDYNLETDSLYLSTQWKEMLGYKDAEIENSIEAWLELIHPEEHNKALKMFKMIQTGSVSDHESEYRMRCKDGTYRWIQVQLSVVFDSHKRPLRVLGTHCDITEREQTQALLKESEQDTRVCFHRIPLLCLF